MLERRTNKRSRPLDWLNLSPLLLFIRRRETAVQPFHFFDVPLAKPNFGGAFQTVMMAGR